MKGRRKQPDFSATSANSDLEAWNRGARYWSANVSSDIFREVLLIPETLRLLGPLQGKKVLDAGSGDGYIASKIREAGAQVTAIDGSSELVKIAKNTYAKPGLDFFEGDLRSPLGFTDGAFDAVVASMILMDFDPIEDALKEFFRVLTPKGILVASILHPAFASAKLTKSLTELLGFKPPHYRVSRYSSRFRENRHAGGMPDLTAHYHRPIGHYFKTIRNAGFSITDFEEPIFKKEFVAGKNNFIKLCAEIPLFLIFKAEKEKK